MLNGKLYVSHWTIFSRNDFAMNDEYRWDKFRNVVTRLRYLANDRHSLLLQ